LNRTVEPLEAPIKEAVKNLDEIVGSLKDFKTPSLEPNREHIISNLTVLRSRIAELERIRPTCAQEGWKADWEVFDQRIVKPHLTLSQQVWASLQECQQKIARNLVDIQEKEKALDAHRRFIGFLLKLEGETISGPLAELREKLRTAEALLSGPHAQLKELQDGMSDLGNQLKSLSVELQRVDSPHEWEERIVPRHTQFPGSKADEFRTKTVQENLRICKHCGEQENPRESPVSPGISLRAQALKNELDTRSQ
jgi:DNA repair exonuclease SbcCD ATPase subunit